MNKNFRGENVAYAKTMVWKLLKKLTFSLLTGFLLLILATGTAAVIPILSKNVINSILKSSSLGTFFGLQITLLVLASLLREVLTYSSYYIFESRVRLFGASLRELVFSTAQQRFIEISDIDSGRLLTYISSDTERLQKFIYPTLIFFLKDLFTLSFAAISGIFIAPVVVILSATPLVIFFVVAHFVNPKIRALTDQVLESQTQFISRLKEYIQGMETFLVFLKEKFSIAKFKEMSREYAKSDIRRIKTVVLFNIPLALLFNSGYVIAIVSGVYRMKAGFMNPGSFVAALMIVSFIYDSAKSFWDFNLHCQELNAVWKRLSEILKYEPQETRSKITGKYELRENIAQLSVYVPTFSYSQNEVVLKDFRLYAEKGMAIGIFGKSGIGKTTAIRIILGLIGRQENFVRVNGKDLSSIELRSYWSKIGYLPQQSVIFKGTVLENIFLGEAGELESDIALLLDDIKLDKIVEEGGKNLSGGQRQRIAIARTFAHGKKDMYILDEPTTYLDQSKVNILKDIIKRRKADSVFILISHSMPFLKELCDEIIHME